jgi:hypothetical protein
MKRLLLLTFLLLLIAPLNAQIQRYPFYAPTSAGSGGSAEPPSFLSSDGYTVGWYIADEESTITTFDDSGTDVITEWEDYLGSGRDLLPLNSGEGPVYSGGVVHCIDRYYGNSGLKATFTYVQPEMIYMVCTQEDWTAVNTMIDGGAGDGRIRQNDSSPNLRASAGTYSSENTNMPLETWVIVRVLFNGASSKFQINETTATTWTSGSANMGGFTIGNARGGGLPVEMYVKEIILRSVADDTEDEQAIYDYLEAKYELALWLILLLLPNYKRKLRIAA